MNVNSGPSHFSSEETKLKLAQEKWCEASSSSSERDVEAAPCIDIPG